MSPRHKPTIDKNRGPTQAGTDKWRTRCEYHDPGRCTDQAALLRQAISLTEQLIQMKEDEIFVKTGRGRDDF